MNATVFINSSSNALLALRPKSLSDGSQVWDLHFCKQEEIAFASEKEADEAMDLIVQALHKSMDKVQTI